MQSLAVKYRPKSFSEVVEQDEIKIILANQIKKNDLRNAYLFVGGAGTGKTTNARIFANELNEGNGNPIEIDGASNNGVEQVRDIIQQARTRSITGKYKIFIVDECHMLTVQAWNAMLKIIEEPPENTIFIFCTTNPEKIPNTIMSRVQRYDFRRITEHGITERLEYIAQEEHIDIEQDAIEYIARMADGHMRTAISILDKCSNHGHVSTESVCDDMGEINYYDYATIINFIAQCNDFDLLTLLEFRYDMGTDFKQLIDGLLEYALDYAKWRIIGSMSLCYCPRYCEEWFKKHGYTTDTLSHLINTLIDIKNSIKYETRPKTIVEARLLLEIEFIRSLNV